MGTTIYVQPSTATGIVQNVFERVDEQMSEWKKDSPLTNVNVQAGKSPVLCPIEVCSAIELALSIAKQTDGAFDPTWAALWELWDFKVTSLPEATLISSRLHLVNWKLVVIEQNTIYLPKVGMAIGLGGIAKGIALNHARDALVHAGITDFMIVAGGQVLAQGATRRIGIRKPDGISSEFIGVVEITNACVSTSGDYERYFEVDGVRYHHIIDPRTGFPARGVRSVTVVAKDAAVADALSTALFVLGVETGLEFVECTERVEALFIDRNSRVHKSSGFKLE
jgi:thiamine biosynthesis lipoprotein